MTQSQEPGASVPDSVALDAHQSDPARRRRLRWRARRGLLENDLLVSRFLDKHEANLTDPEVAALHQLLELTDNDLLDVLLARTEVSAEWDSPAMRSILQRLGRDLATRPPAHP